MYSEIENKEEIKQSKEPFFHHRTKRIFANSVDVLESFTILRTFIYNLFFFIKWYYKSVIFLNSSFLFCSSLLLFYET